MTRSRNNKYQKRTLRKKNKRENKSKRRNKRTVSKKKKKRTQKKKRINLQIGGNVEPMMARVLHTLERDIIEYLPSTKVIDSIQSEKHYIEMVDYIKLQEIINNNENFKKSPKIRKLFDYDLYEINEKDMYFVYKDFKCENIFKDVDKYYIYILYFYLMECNITKNDKIQDGGAIEENKELSDPVSDLDDPIAENTPETKIDEVKVDPEPTPGPTPPPAASPPAPTPAPIQAPTPTPAPGDTPKDKEKDNEGKVEDIKVDVNDIDIDIKIDKEEEKKEPEKGPEKEPEKKEDILKEEMDELKKEEKDEEKDDMEESLELVDADELPGFKEYEETREMLDMKSNVVNGNIKITNSDLIKYKVNWFNVCLGIDIFDTGFENKVNTKIEELGIKPFKRDKFLEKIEIILDDKEMTSNFKNAIYERLMENCKEPEKFLKNKKKCEKPLNSPFGKILKLFRKCHENDMKDNRSILYLYDKYKTILNRNKTIINNVDLILIILNCEIRQRILSYHISVEIIRRRNNKNTTINSILQNIYQIDKPIIQQVESELRNKIAQEKIERMKLVEQVNKEEIEIRKQEMLKKREPELIKAILEKKNNEENDEEDSIDNDVNNYLIGKDKNTDDFINQHQNKLKNNQLMGGSEIEELSLESDMLETEPIKISLDEDDKYDIYNNKSQSDFCSSIKDTIDKEHMQKPILLNKCKNF